MLVLAKLTVSAMVRIFGGGGGEAADHCVQLQLHSGDRKLEPGRTGFRGTRVPHRLPEVTKSRRTHTSPAPRSHC